MSNSKTRQLTLIAMLSALSFILSYPIFKFPLLPSANFLQIDFTILPILIGLFMLNLKSALVILMNRSILWFIFNMQGVNDYIGLPMNIIAIGVYIAVFWLFLRKGIKWNRYITATIVATFSLTGTMVVINYIYAIPVYSKFANFDIATMFPGGVYAYIISVILFNLLESIIYAVSFAIIYMLISKNKTELF